jgi:hypothetical protein
VRERERKENLIEFQTYLPTIDNQEKKKKKILLLGVNPFIRAYFLLSPLSLSLLFSLYDFILNSIKIKK